MKVINTANNEEEILVSNTKARKCDKIQYWYETWCSNANGIFLFPSRIEADNSGSRIREAILEP